MRSHLTAAIILFALAVFLFGFTRGVALIQAYDVAHKHAQMQASPKPTSKPTWPATPFVLTSPAPTPKPIPTPTSQEVSADEILTDACRRAYGKNAVSVEATDLGNSLYETVCGWSSDFHGRGYSWGAKKNTITVAIY